MHRLLLVPLVWLASSPGTQADPSKTDRGVDPFFVTFEIFQPLESSLPFGGLRATARFGRFGLEAGASRLALPIVKMADLSVVTTWPLSRASFLLRAGVVGFRAYDYHDFSNTRDDVGFLVGASVFTGKKGDRVRVRFDYTYRGHPRGGVSSLGLGLVIPLG